MTEETVVCISIVIYVVVALIVGSVVYCYEYKHGGYYKDPAFCGTFCGVLWWITLPWMLLECVFGAWAKLLRWFMDRGSRK